MLTTASCIYVITDKSNTVRYVGQTFNFRTRYCHYFSALKRQRYENVRLQRYYNKYGKDAFKIEPILYCPIKELDEYEKKYIKKYDTFYKNNRSGWNFTEGGLRKKPENWSKYKTFTLWHPDHGEITHRNQNEFCRIYNVDQAAIWRVLNKRQFAHLEWQLPNNIKITKRAKNQKYNYTFSHPVEGSITIFNVNKFCKQFNLRQGIVAHLVTGKIKTHKQWVLIEKKLIDMI